MEVEQTRQRRSRSIAFDEFIRLRVWRSSPFVGTALDLKISRDCPPDPSTSQLQTSTRKLQQQSRRPRRILSIVLDARHAVTMALSPQM